MNITQTQLKNIINEAIKKYLVKEDYCWYGDTKPIETIIECCNQLMENSQFNDSDYEGDEDEAAAYHLYEWAKKVADDAEQYLHCNSRNISINGGENW